MRRLAGASRQVPKSYLVSTFARYKVEKRTIANGGFADIRKGRLNGMDVAVKTLRALYDVNIDMLHEVRARDYLFHPLQLTKLNSGLLQGMRGLDERVSPQYSSAYCCQNQT